MDTWTRVLAVVIVGLLWCNGTALAQSPPGCDKTSTPERFEGQVVKVDSAQSRVTIRNISRPR